MMAPAQAARTTIHRGMTSDFGTGSGMAVVKTSWLLIGLSLGAPMYGSFEILATVIVESLTSASGDN